MSDGRYTQSDFAGGGQHQYGIYADWGVLHGVTLASPGEYNWTIHVQWQYSLMSTCFDHLLLLHFLLYEYYITYNVQVWLIDERNIEIATMAISCVTHRCHKIFLTILYYGCNCYIL